MQMNPSPKAEAKKNIIEMVKELQELEKTLPSHGQGYALDSSGVYDKGLTEEVIGMDNGVFYMEKKEVEFIIQSRNHFPDIAQALLIAVEALETTLVDLEGTRCVECGETEMKDSDAADYLRKALSKIRSIQI